MNKNEWRDAYVDWLEKFYWRWFCTLTFRPELPEAHARWRMRKWVSALRAELGTEEFGFFAVREYGTTGMDFHYHILVTGLRDWHAEERVEWMRRWFKLAGDASITEFKPGCGGVRYILKFVGPNDQDATQFELSSASQMPEQFPTK